MRLRYVFGVLAAMAAVSPARAADKVEINVSNDRDEAIVMRFEYAFRDYTWKLMEHKIDAGDGVLYRFPANIPGCERLRDWHITDGILTISNANGPLCTKRVSLCDKYETTMAVGKANCKWSVH